MAHMIDLRVDCAECGSLATNEVFDSRKVSVGRYCWKHAQAKMAQLQREEVQRT